MTLPSSVVRSTPSPPGPTYGRISATTCSRVGAAAAGQWWISDRTIRAVIERTRMLPLCPQHAQVSLALGDAVAVEPFEQGDHDATADAEDRLQLAHRGRALRPEVGADRLDRSGVGFARQ